MNRLSSTRLRLEPRPPIFISSSACDMSYFLSWVSLRASFCVGSRPSCRVGSRASPPSACGLRPELAGAPQHRLHDVLVAGAAPQVARHRPAPFFLARSGIPFPHLPLCQLL